jgi:hypothetical protein
MTAEESETCVLFHLTVAGVVKHPVSHHAVLQQADAVDLKQWQLKHL